ncbi:MAG: cytochrome ubiquinol oxidase subunit I [Fimbriimonadales bacterium]
MELDALSLSRFQFALTVAFHYLFPPLTIGLGVIMVYTEGKFLRTKDPQYEALTRFLTRIFAVTFAMGVASGIVMEFQFGTNWSTYSRYVGDVFGSALAAEGIFAFFLESGFLAVLVFGWDRVSPKMHFFSTCMVSLGSMFSAIWIVVANSWQQTPAGHKIVEFGTGQRAEIISFWELVFNPSSMHRLGHVLLGAFILGSFFVMSISAYYILKKRFEEPAKRMFSAALGLGTIASILAAFSGHFQAANVAETQPTKLAAFEGLFVTPKEGEGAPLYIIGFPDQESRTVKAGIAVPGLLSWLVYGDMGRPVAGLDQFPPDEWPPVALTFHSYHIMVLLGVFFIVITLFAQFLRWRGTLFQTRWLMWVFVFAIIGPYIANQLGWMAAEVGRQPWVVYGLLKTADAFSPTVPAAQIATSIALFIVIYTLLFFLWLFVLNNKIHQGPVEIEVARAKREAGFFEAAAEAAAPGKQHLTGREATEDGEEKEEE